MAQFDRRIHTLISILFLLGITTLFSQEFNSKLHNPQPGLPEMELVILPYGMDYPVKLGTVKPDGGLHFQMPDSKVDFLPKEQLEWTFGDLDFAFEFSCSNQDHFGNNPNVKAVKGGYIGLWHKGRWAGTIFPLSDENLLPWREDSSYMEPIKASFYEIVYVTEDVTISTTCNTVWNLSNEDINATYSFDLSLKTGYNLVAYHIQEIHKTDPNETASKPSKVLITNVNADFDRIKWVVKYF
ncbi:hypothetical protein U1E44_15575 [Arenibacter sp. GZD96]|uniref:hypothetical protein n=1 Tax=Aurantibrevibacter litoralis TaxID=3106030 RepID=UPI002AFE95F9|nr:hypothetical protein [Arenibacter sp. GZD-96]MEA1787521.1 hypothetical protein [Arenibacter sp. GZD-96]